ncbi:MAG: hypothetical protein H2054_08355 [Sphingomonas sp.]|uniref:hypothetical protein n=1 Tax=Sphingomonas sp. TaxID=28214 RepID=UPI0017D62BF3|nr:hypothetical protein [Sphingomonas sp.]
MRLCSAAATLSALGVATMAWAQQGSPPKALAAVSACRSVKDDAQRLACFDKAVAAFDASVQSRDVVVVDRDSLAKERRRQFGRARKDDPVLSLSRTPDPVELKGTVQSVRPAGQFFVVAVQGIGIWQTTEATFVPPVSGVEVRITKGSLGGYLMSYGSRAVRARRIG